MKKFAVFGVVAGAIVAGFLAGLMAVSSNAQTPAPAPALIEGRMWTLTSWSDPATIPAAGITLMIRDGQVSGSDSCNRYFGPVELGDLNFSAGDMATTMMACLDDGVAQAEQSYLGLLREANQWTLDGQDLVLSRDGAQLLRFIV